LNKELNKKNEKAKIIQEAKKKYQYVKDEIVIDLMRPHIQQLERDGKDWILEGFPRTLSQAVFLQKLGIAPDYIFNIQVKDQNVAM